MAFVYDVLRLFRRLVRHGRFAVDLEDILYWTVCFLLSFTLLYYGNNGVVRFAAVLGAAVGMFLYIVTVGRFFVRISFFILDRTFGTLFRLIRKIILTLRRLLRPVKQAARNFFVKLFQKIRLTYTKNRHKIKERNAESLQETKGETADVRKKGKKKRKKGRNRQRQDTGISPCQK